jgi:integrase
MRNPQTRSTLRSHRASLVSIMLALGQDDALVLGSAEGETRHPGRFPRTFEYRLVAARKQLGADRLSPLRLHDLRHTHATLLLRAGVHREIVSERLGHAKVSITLDVSSHAVPTLHREAASKLASLVYGLAR